MRDCTKLPLATTEMVVCLNTTLTFDSANGGLALISCTSSVSGSKIPAIPANYYAGYAVNRKGGAERMCRAYPVCLLHAGNYGVHQTARDRAQTPKPELVASFFVVAWGSLCRLQVSLLKREAPEFADPVA